MALEERDGTAQDAAVGSGGSHPGQSSPILPIQAGDRRSK
jgi:hypothetical protein